MAGVSMPGHGRLPDGPQRDLTAAVHALYIAAGLPGTRRISNAVRERDDLPTTVSHEAVRAILAGSRSSWHKVESVVRQLAAWSVAEPDVATTVRKIHKLWLAAADPAEPIERVESADPALFRQAVRGIYGPTDTDAIGAFLRTTVHVPRAPGGALLVAATSSEGLWVCAFTDNDRIRAYARDIRALQAIAWTPILGRELVRLVSRLDHRLGILIDPPATSDHDVSETLPLPHDLVAELTATLS